MWLALLLALWNGGTMSDQVKPSIVGPALIPVTPALPEPRTRADVEADLALAGLELHHHRSRRGDHTNNAERLAQRPSLMVLELNVLIEEWAAMSTPRPTV